MTQLNIFDDDEKQYINSLAKGRKEITRQDVLKMTAFAKEVSNEADPMIFNLIDSVYSKVNSLNDSEWENLRALIPFPVIINYEDLVLDI